MLTFGGAELSQMKRVEVEVAGVLHKYRQNTEAGLVAFALIRCARVLLRCYPKATQKELISVCVDYLNGRTQPRDPASSLILQ